MKYVKPYNWGGGWWGKVVGGLGDGFLDLSPGASKGNGSKNKEVGLHQTKKLLHSKINQQNQKATY